MCRSIERLYPKHCGCAVGVMFIHVLTCFLKDDFERISHLMAYENLSLGYQMFLQTVTVSCILVCFAAKIHGIPFIPSP